MNLLCVLPYDLLVLLHTCYLDPVDALVLRCACQRLRAVIIYASIRTACKHRLYKHALEHAYISRLEWLNAPQQQRISVPRDIHLALAAVHSGRLDMLQWAYCRGAVNSGTFADDMCDTAVSLGQLDMLQWMASVGFSLETASAAAARAGHVHILEWLHLTRNMGVASCFFAACGGQLHALQWLRERHYDWDAGTCSAAAGNGHLHVLRWARENGCNWDAMTAYMAVQYGYADVLRYAHEHGCAWHADTFSTAAQYGHVAILCYAREQQPAQWIAERASVERTARQCNQQAVLAWLESCV